MEGAASRGAFLFKKESPLPAQPAFEILSVPVRAIFKGVYGNGLYGNETNFLTGRKRSSADFDCRDAAKKTAPSFSLEKHGRLGRTTSNRRPSRTAALFSRSVFRRLQGPLP